MGGAGQPPRDTSWDYDDDDDRDDYEDVSDGADDNYLRDRCVLGADCLVADPYHSADECFDVEMAKAFHGEEGRTDG
jgi:hypothetical protein